MRNVDEGKQTLMQINDSILAVAGLDVHKNYNAGSKRQSGLTSVGEMCGGDGNDSCHRPIRMLHNLTSTEVRRLTCFNDLKMMLSYITMVFDGNLNFMTRTISRMKWLEERILTLELLWRHTM
jgi:hypothetical protein